MGGGFLVMEAVCHFYDGRLFRLSAAVIQTEAGYSGYRPSLPKPRPAIPGIGRRCPNRGRLFRLSAAVAQTRAGYPRYRPPFLKSPTKKRDLTASLLLFVFWFASFCHYPDEYAESAEDDNSCVDVSVIHTGFFYNRVEFCFFPVKNCIIAVFTVRSP